MGSDIPAPLRPTMIAIPSPRAKAANSLKLTCAWSSQHQHEHARHNTSLYMQAIIDPDFQQPQTDFGSLQHQH